jgi:DNA-binding response OmpR family regulator
LGFRKKSENVPLFVLGAGESADGILVLDLGADDYITKPINSTEFVVRVRNRIEAVFDAKDVAEIRSGAHYTT